jgi:hypothetical protein
MIGALSISVDYMTSVTVNVLSYYQPQLFCVPSFYDEELRSFDDFSNNTKDPHLSLYSSNIFGERISIPRVVFMEPHRFVYLDIFVEHR